MDKEILCTYFTGTEFTFEWITENEVDEWLDINRDKYTKIEIVKVVVTEVLYEENMGD